MFTIDLQFGCPTVLPMIASPYAVDTVPRATNKTRRTLKVFSLRLMPNILGHLAVDSSLIGDVV